MDKAEYIATRVLPEILRFQTVIAEQRTLFETHAALSVVDGFGSFMAAQVVADLKNTPGTTQRSAPDWYDFVAMGPGSKRGLNRVMGRGLNDPLRAVEFEALLKVLRERLVEANVMAATSMAAVGDRVLPYLCLQDLQNCLCEYDKYMRIKAGGKSRSGYDPLRHPGYTL